MKVHETNTHITHTNDDGILHREDGPAITNKITGKISWYFNGVLHRENGPAVTFDQSIKRENWTYTEEYYHHGKRHREDGPAIVSSTGINNSYYINDKLISKKDYLLLTRIKKLKSI